MKNGFTLIELLVVIAIMGILGLIFTNTLVQTLRSQNKVKVINQVKQNGQVTIEKLSNEIRQAEKVVCVGASSGSLADTIVIYKAGTYSRYRVIAETSSSNGYITRNNFNLQNGDIPADTEESSFCGGTANYGLDVVTLTDTDTATGVSIKFDNSTPIFKVLASQAGYADVITIQFRAGPGISTGALFENLVEDGGVLFKTSVGVRGGKK